MISHIVNRKRFTGQSHYLDSLAYGVLSRVMVEDTSVLIPGVVQTKKIIVASVYYLPLPTACIQDDQVYCGSQADTPGPIQHLSPESSSHQRLRREYVRRRGATKASGLAGFQLFSQPFGKILSFQDAMVYPPLVVVVVGQCNVHLGQGDTRMSLAYPVRGPASVHVFDDYMLDFEPCPGDSRMASTDALVENYVAGVGSVRTHDAISLPAGPLGII
jgi:hypothetical protein